MSREPVTASEVAEELECTRRTVLKKLDELAERGDIQSKKVGARSRVWWRSDEPGSAVDRGSAHDGDGTGGLEVSSSGLEGPPSDAAGNAHLETELEEVFDRISDAFYALDTEWQFTHVNERAEELIDYRGEGLVGRNFWEVFEWATDSRLGEEYRTAMETQEPTAFEFYYPQPLDAWYEVNAYPSETGLSVYFRDVTERKHRERELGESERRYRTLVEHFPNGAVALFDEDLRYRVTGGDILEDVDVSSEEVVGQTVWERYPEDVAAKLEPNFRAALDGEQNTFEFEYHDRHWLAHTVPVSDDGDDVFAGMLMVQDITERKRTEQELRKSEKQLRALIELLPVAVFVAEKDGKIVEWNEAAKEIWGGEIAESESVAEYEEYDGWWAETGEPLEPEEWPLARALQGEEVTDPEVIEIEGFDGERRTVLHHGTPVRDEDGEVSRAVVTLIDITEREQREQRLQRQNERLEGFASMLAHELRNPVTIGQIYSNQLPADGNPEAVEHVTEAFDRIEDIIDVMLVLTRGREAVGERTSVDLPDVARRAWDNVETSNATAEIEIDRTIEADETYIRHLFQNLFENAVEHGSTSSRPEGDNSVEHGGADVHVTVGDLPTGFYVADDGPGIPADRRDAVFDAGYTTAADQGGTGLGLAFVAELAEVYGWDYTVTESADGGARFEFTDIDQASPRSRR